MDDELFTNQTTFTCRNVYSNHNFPGFFLIRPLQFEKSNYILKCCCLNGQDWFEYTKIFLYNQEMKNQKSQTTLLFDAKNDIKALKWYGAKITIESPTSHNARTIFSQIPITNNVF